MLTESEKLNTLSHLGVELNKVNDLDILMEYILTKAREFVNADAGSIYIREKHKLNFTYTQNTTLQMQLPKGEKLIYSTFSIPIDEKSIAGYVAETGDVLNITDVYELDPVLPYHFSKRFDDTTGYKTQSILTIPLKNTKNRVLGILQIINAQDEENKIRSFDKKDEDIMYHFASIAAVALERAQMTRAMILRMISMAEMRDPEETGAHVNRVAGYTIEIYERWAARRNIPQKEVDKIRDVLRMASMLHDVGKIATSDLILKKPAKLSKQEFEIIKRHTIEGARLFLNSQSDFDEAAGVVTLTHHERWDGMGYPGHVNVITGKAIEGYILPDGSPRGKRGEEIPLFGRIVSLADVFDALTSKRSYKEAWNESDTLNLIEKDSGKKFDPELVEIFFSRLDILKSIQQRYQEKTNSIRENYDE